MPLSKGIGWHWSPHAVVSPWMQKVELAELGQQRVLMGKGMWGKEGKSSSREGGQQWDCGWVARKWEAALGPGTCESKPDFRAACAGYEMLRSVSLKLVAQIQVDSFWQLLC